MQNLRKAFISLTSELCPVHNEKAMAKALKKVKEQHSDATMDDAKDYFVMLSLDKKNQSNSWKRQDKWTAKEETIQVSI